MSEVALVTGSSSGIGKGIAKELIESGYIVYINGRNEETVKKTCLELGEMAKPLVYDMQNSKEIKKALEKINSDEQKLSLVVGNIGSGRSIPGWNIPIEEYLRIFNINLFGAINLCTEATHHLKNRGGQIIFISSIAGCESVNGAPVPYTTAKAGLLSFAKSYSFEVAKYKIRINTISPGNTLFEDSVWDKKLKEDKHSVKQYIEDNVALNTFIDPKDIGKTVLFLENTPTITGSNIVVDGGQTRKFT